MKTRNKIKVCHVLTDSAVGGAGRAVAELISATADLSEGLEYFDTDSASWKSIDGTKYAAKNEAGRYVITLDPGAGLLMRVAGK